MQEETTEKTISLCIRGTKVTGAVLKAALRKLVTEMEKQKQGSRQKKQVEMAAGKSVSRTAAKRGKQSLKRMMDGGSQLTNIEVTDSNIKSFERVARKYSIDYSLKKDSSTQPPRYLVFFRAKDVDVMTAAFKEYAGISAQKKPKMSIRKKLQIAKDRAAKQREREKAQKRDRGQEL